MPDIDVDLIGEIGQASVSSARTSAPWDLAIDSLVISVAADGVGRLGESFLRSFPSAPLRSTDLSALSPTSPVVLALTGAGTPALLTRLVLASVRETHRPGYGSADLTTVATAAVEAIRAAVRAGGRRVGLPLLGAGVDGLPPGPAARAIADAVLDLLSDGSMADLRSLILFDIEPSTVEVISIAWRDAIAATASGPVAHDASPVIVEGAFLSSAGPEEPVPPSGNIALSGTARSAVMDAAGLADAGHVPITPALLWYAALRRGPSSGRRDVAVALLDAVTGEPPGDLLDRLALVNGVAGATATATPREVDPATVATVLAAVPLAARVNSAQVRQRHLLAAAVLDPDGASAIGKATGWTADEARRRLRSAIAAILPREFPDTWDAILLLGDQPATDESAEQIESAYEGSGETAPTADPMGHLDSAFSEDIVSVDKRIPLSDDSLDLKTYVTMLAAAIARTNTPLPLSIGLFGEWGSGKSYFMGLLRSEIDKLGNSSDGAYLTDVEQITFNAWHYTDANLWASLASTIFERLGRKTGSIAGRRQTLVDQLDGDRSKAKRLDIEAERARLEQARLEAELQRKRAEVAGSGATLLAAVQRSKTVQAAAEKAWKTLGIESPVEQQQLLVREAQGLDAEWFALRRAARGRRIALLTAVVVIALVVFGAAAFAPANVRQWLTGGSSVALLGVLAAGSALLRQARSAVHQISSAVNETAQAALELADEKLEPLHSRVNSAANRASALTSEHDQLMTRISQVENQLSELDPGRRWYDFVAERAASPDYQRQLGLISIIRRDFEQLISLMKDWRDHPADEPENRPINRIVLYIDDLDRCSPRQVMDVLQAVHLILALDLFVVVVGVDPRWLLQSLRQQYRDNFSGGAATSPADEGWRADPLDYLEKIFNIPFVLPRMTASSFKTLIERISDDSDRRAADHSEEHAAELTADPNGRNTPPISAGEPGAGSAPAAAGSSLEAAHSEPAAKVPPITAESGSEVSAALRGRPLPGIGLTQDELTLLAALGPVVESPREAKRLLNVYRMLRSLRAVGSAGDFLHRPDGGGDYQALGILLGVLSAKPALIGQLLWAPPTDGRPGGLAHRSAVGTWTTAVRGLRPTRVTGVDYFNDLGRLSAPDRRDWTDLLGKLSGASALVTLADLSSFQVWGPYVARFSFVLSPLAATIDSNTSNNHVPVP